MKLSIVLSTQPAQFQAATFKGDLETNLQRIVALGYDGVELAIRDPKLVDLPQLEHLTHACKLSVPAIGTGQAWGRKACRSQTRTPRSDMQPSSGSSRTSRWRLISGRRSLSG